jgi:hypothetical protein
MAIDAFILHKFSQLIKTEEKLSRRERTKLETTIYKQKIETNRDPKGDHKLKWISKISTSQQAKLSEN